ncbi:phage portal protein [Salinispora arenicola]|uniref:phage portal protein n=1 Tax=Salinispora arenicola TaxID=168697 RepID=UPI0016A684DD|nr:phage portal protein [Salinispora arenicola]NIL64774.1 phage portal protein [Salinispora arenicola]
MGLSAVYRAVSLISGTIAQLPLRTLRMRAGRLDRVGSILDDPQPGFGLTPFEWVETIMLHLLLHGNAYLTHVHNGAGALYALIPHHPLCVEPYWPRPDDRELPVGGRWYRVTDIWGRQSHTTRARCAHFGAEPGRAQRRRAVDDRPEQFRDAIAGDRAAAKMFSSGALISGLVTPDDADLEGDEATAIKAELLTSVGGWENAGSIAVVNRRLKFTPWTMSAADAQFLQSRQFSIEEVARWFGVPPHLLMQTEKQTSWGTGVAEQNRGLGRFTLSPWTARVEQRLSRLLGAHRWAEFDFAGLERPNVETEIDLVIKQMQAGLITRTEARALRNLGPTDEGDDSDDEPV